MLDFYKAEIVHKSLNGLSPDGNLFHVVTSTTVMTCEILQISLLFPCHVLLNCYKNSFSYGGAGVPWSRLPSNVRQAASLTLFRKLLRHSDTEFM